MNEAIQVLIAEDRPADADLMVRELAKAGFAPDWQRVTTAGEFRRRLTPSLDIILLDHHIPSFASDQAMAILKESGLDVPIIVVTGSLDDVTAAQMLASGATDYVLKDRLARLGYAVRRALQERAVRLEKETAEAALRASEEQMRGILGNLEDVVWSMDPDTSRMLYLNPAAGKLFSRPVADLLATPRLFVEAAHPDDRIAVEGFFASVIKWGTAEGTHRYLQPGGSIRHVHARAWTAFDPGGRPSRLEGIHSDVTERHLAEERQRRLDEVQRDQERLEQADRFKTDFIRVMAHELNNASAPLRLDVRQLANMPPGTLDAKRQRALASLDRGLQRMTAYLGELLDFTRLQAGALVLHLEDVDLGSILDACILTARPQAEAAGVGLASQALPRLRLPADARRLEHLFSNLLVNAIKFTPRGGAVRVALEAGPSEAVVTVQDTGCGIDPADLPRLFQSFSRIGHPEQGAHTGTGLGLYLCKGIAEQHDGSLAAASPGPGRGSTFTVRLPLAGPGNTTGDHADEGSTKAPRQPSGEAMA
ncbi:MAG TPA: ATP-binding protein [Candidatus Thermoplasmatota archaeon]|nr:ATP-binding protein [Candidatus Thermoplasmatota archaeon]